MTRGGARRMMFWWVGFACRVRRKGLGLVRLWGLRRGAHGFDGGFHVFIVVMVDVLVEELGFRQG